MDIRQIQGSLCLLVLLMKKQPPCRANELKPSNKCTLGSHSTLPHPLTPFSTRNIDTTQKPKSAKDSFHISQLTSLVSEQTLPLHHQMHTLQSEIRNLTHQLYLERNTHTQLVERMADEMAQLTQRMSGHEDLHKQKAEPDRYPPSDSRKIQLMEGSIALLFQRIDSINDNRISIGTEGHQIIELGRLGEVVLRLEEQVQGTGIEIRKMSKEIRLQIAELHDQLCDFEDTVKQHISTVGDKLRLCGLQNTVTQINQKVSSLQLSADKSSTDIEQIQCQLETHSLWLQKLEASQAKSKEFLDLNLCHLKSLTESHSSSIEDFLSTRLSKMIESYNYNFQQMDRSITELRQTVKEVLSINRLISDNLNSKLKNTIDSNTFHKTISSMNSKFSQTYLMNHERIQELNSKEYEVEHEITQMKDVLEGLKMDFRYNYNRMRLEEEVSVSGRVSQSDEGDMRRRRGDGERERGRGFKKPNYIFPERDSFNFAEERRRRTLEVDDWSMSEIS